MAEGGWRCGQWSRDGSWRGLVPTAAGSRGVGVGVLEVHSPMPGCVCRVLGVCFWHLFCYIKKTKLSVFDHHLG